jgi:hypothetical protein
MRRTCLVLGSLSLMVAMLALSASPALARAFNADNFFFNPNNDGFFFDNNGFFDHNNNGTAQESETGDVTENFTVDQTGTNSNQCVTPQQFGNTGSSQNGQGVLQFNSLSGEIEPEGNVFIISPVISGGCTQTIDQSSAAG